MMTMSKMGSSGNTIDDALHCNLDCHLEQNDGQVLRWRVIRRIRRN